MDGASSGGAPCERLTDQVVREFCGAYREAWNSRQPERVLALATEDVLWEDPTIPGGVARGHAEVRAWLEGFWRAFPDMEFEPWYAPSADPLDGAFLTRDGLRLAVPWRCRGTMLGAIESPGFAANGRALRLTGVNLYVLRDRRACHVQTVVNLAEAGTQLRLVPAADSAALRLVVRLQRLRARLRSWVSGPGRRPR